MESIQNRLKIDCPKTGLNIVVQNPAWCPRLEQLLFHDEPVNRISPDSKAFDLFDLLVMLDIFPSRGQAKKGWNKPGGPGFPPGFHDWFIGKRRVRITTWVPVMAGDTL